MTRNIALGAVLSSARAAWPIAHAWNVVRTMDPERGRRQILAVFYFAAAGWRVAVSAVGAIGFFLVVDVILGRNVPFDHVLATLLTLCGGASVNACVGLIGIVVALLMRQRVWVSPIMIADDSGRRSFSVRRNETIFVVTPAVTLPLLTPGCALLAQVDANGRPVHSALGFALLITGAVLTVATIHWVSRRVIATVPTECWPKGLSEAAAVDETERSVRDVDCDDESTN